MDTSMAAQLASLATSQINQQQQQQQDHYHDAAAGAANGNKRKTDDGQQGQSKARRSRYISLACNECKRRKIKCNGQTPCQRCGNLNLECVYAPNCCNGFKDSQEYKDMAETISVLQEHVSILFHNLSDLRAVLGQPAPPMPQQQLQHQLEQHLQQQPQQGTPIDPSLHSQQYAPHNGSFSGPHGSPGAPIASMSPAHVRQRSQSQQQHQHQQQPTFRGPMSTDFSLGVAKSSLQTMGINSQTEGGVDGSGDASGMPSPTGSPAHMEHSMQLIQGIHESKDPIWRISKEEALRLCRVYEDEMGLMYPVLNIENVVSYTERLYVFVDAMRRNGLMQEGMPGADAIDDEDTTILKLVIACALTMEGCGRSDLGQRMFENVRTTVDNYVIGPVGIKGIQALTMTAMYEFHRDNEGGSWKMIGIASRSCLQLGLHRHETYEAITDESGKSEAILLFWSVYVLDRRWSFGTGMPFALQDADIDPLLPRPEERSPYLSAMIRYCEIGGKVWQSVVSTPSPANSGVGPIRDDEMGYLDYQVIQWHRSIPPILRFEHPSQQGRLSTPIGPPPSRAGHRLRVILYLRANQMRIHIYRPVLHSATSIMGHREQAQTVVDVAKDAIRVLTHINQTSDLYHTQQVLFNAFLTSALAVLFLAVSHTPAVFADNVREEFYMALELVRGFSKGSFVSKRLWRTIRGLKEVGPKLGLTALKDSGQVAQSPAKDAKDEPDPNRSAAVAMAGLRAGLAGQSVDELSLYNGSQHAPKWPSAGENSSSPENMANDLTSLFEAAGGLQAIGQQSQDERGGQYPGVDGSVPPTQDSGFGEGVEGYGVRPGAAAEELSGILKELF